MCSFIRRGVSTRLKSFRGYANVEQVSNILHFSPHHSQSFATVLNMLAVSMALEKNTLLYYSSNIDNGPWLPL